MAANELIMRGKDLYIWMYYFVMGSSLWAQNIYFKGRIGVGAKSPMVIYSKTHLIETLLPTHTHLIYKGTDTQHLKNQQPLHIGSLEVNNPNGLGVQQSIHIQKRLKLKQGYLYAKPSYEDSLAISETVLHLSFAAILERSHNNNFIALPIAIKNKKHFFFPFGSYEERNSLYFETQTTGLSIEMRHENLRNNTPKEEEYSSLNYLKRQGIVRIKKRGRWKLKSEQNLRIQIRIKIDVASEISTKTVPIGLAGWNKETKNWNLISIISKKNDSLKSDFFAANQYSLITICECIAPSKKYRSYGNFAVSPNGDGINEIPVFKSYKKHRNGQFELFNRQGIRVLKFPWNEVLEGRQSFNWPHIKTDTYFYVLHMQQPKQKEQGYIYIKK